MANLFDYNIKRMISFRFLKRVEKNNTKLGFRFSPVGFQSKFGVMKSHSAEEEKQFWQCLNMSA